MTRSAAVRCAGRSWLLLLLVLAACDIEFVAVNTGGIQPPGTVSVQSEHRDSLRIHLRFNLPTDRHSVAVALDGEELGGRLRQAGRWRHDTTVVVNPARADLRLTIESGERLDIVLPLLTRGAAAHWSDAGSLVIPLSYSEELIPAERTWEVEIVDSIGMPLLRIERQEGVVPNPIVLGRGIIPAGAAEVKVITASRQTAAGSRSGSLGASSDRIDVLTHSTVHVPIPERRF